MNSWSDNGERYLMVVRTFDDEEYAEMAEPVEILNHIDMADCTNEDIEVYRIAFGKDPELLTVHGTWHDFDDPLYIKVTDKSGEVMFEGWGSDH